jgi:hypothetical protein
MRVSYSRQSQKGEDRKMTEYSRKPHIERIGDALTQEKNAEFPVQVIKNGKTYVVPLGALRAADYLRLPTGATIQLRGTVIQYSNDGAENPMRKLVFYPWSFVDGAPFGARVAVAQNK